MMIMQVQMCSCANANASDGAGATRTGKNNNNNSISIRCAKMDMVKYDRIHMVKAPAVVAGRFVPLLQDSTTECGNSTTVKQKNDDLSASVTSASTSSTTLCTGASISSCSSSFQGLLCPRITQDVKMDELKLQLRWAQESTSIAESMYQMATQKADTLSKELIKVQAQVTEQELKHTMQLQTEHQQQDDTQESAPPRQLPASNNHCSPSDKDEEKHEDYGEKAWLPWKHDASFQEEVTVLQDAVWQEERQSLKENIAELESVIVEQARSGKSQQHQLLKENIAELESVIVEQAQSAKFQQKIQNTQTLALQKQVEDLQQELNTLNQTSQAASTTQQLLSSLELSFGTLPEEEDCGYVSDDHQIGAPGLVLSASSSSEQDITVECSTSRSVCSASLPSSSQNGLRHHQVPSTANQTATLKSLLRHEEEHSYNRSSTIRENKYGGGTGPRRGNRPRSASTTSSGSNSSVYGAPGALRRRYVTFQDNERRPVNGTPDADVDDDLSCSGHCSRSACRATTPALSPLSLSPRRQKVTYHRTAARLLLEPHEDGAPASQEEPDDDQSSVGQCSRSSSMSSMTACL
jgi:hypothetical protein